MKIIGSLMREARMAKGKSTEECARALGVSHEVYESYETGRQPITLPELEGLAYLLEIPLEHFWTAPAAPAQEDRKATDISRLFPVRNRMIGAQLRQARLTAKLSLEELAEKTALEARLLEAYELGREPVPVPTLEHLSRALHCSIREFHDRHGPVGAWDTHQRALRDFSTLPLELQEFVSKPVNRPYLELAVRLSEMSVDRLRAVAEGLLEITY